MSALLDRYLPVFAVRERHETTIHAPADVVIEVARTFDMESIPVVHLIFWARAKVMHASPLPDDAPRGLIAATTALGWGVLEEQPGRAIAMGAVCEPWHGDPGFTAIPADQFSTWPAPDRVRIAWTLEAEPLGPAQCRFASETRALPTDEEAARKFHRYWLATSAGIKTIRRLVGPRIKRESERRWREGRVSRVDVAAGV